MKTRWRLVLFCLMPLTLMPAGMLRSMAAEGRQEPARSETSLDPAQPSFRVGETVTVEITWRPPLWLFFIPPMSAGTITLEIKEVIESQGARVMRITLDARSSGTFNSLAGVNVQNHYESLVDLKTVCSRQFKLMQREGKRMQDVQIDFDPEAKKLRVIEWRVTKDSRVESRNETIATNESCIQDLISIFYAVRTLPLQPGAQHSVVLSNDHAKVQPIQVHVGGEETARTDAGVFQVHRINTSGLFGGLFRSGGEFKIWLDKSTRIPVKFEAKVKLGKVTGSLRRYKSGQESDPITH